MRTHAHSKEIWAQMSVSMCVVISNELDTASAAAAHFLLLLLYGEQSDGMYE